MNRGGCFGVPTPWENWHACQQVPAVGREVQLPDFAVGTRPGNVPDLDRRLEIGDHLLAKGGFLMTRQRRRGRSAADAGRPGRPGPRPARRRRWYRYPSQAMAMLDR